MSALLTDLYQLTMLQAYLDEGLHQEATFEIFVRKLPPGRRFLVAAGLEQALQFLETLAFTDDEVAWVEAQGGFSPALLDHLRGLRFSGDVHAMPEGTVFFPDEPVLRVTAPLPVAQLVESRLLNIVHLQTLIASKAARVVLAARRRMLIDFGMRRAHGAEAALFAARASYLAGFDGTATAEAGRLYDVPVFGTMAHAFVQAHACEADSFVAFARSRPQRPTLLVDTYDTLRGVDRVVEVAPRLAAEGIEVGGVRLDSGDLEALAKEARRRLDAAGLRRVKIVASGNLDEWRVAELLAARAPIDGFGVGTALGTSSDAPSIDAVYKLQQYAGVARRKRSAGKATWPGIKQVWRRHGADGRLAGDRVQLAEEPGEGKALLQPAMRAGRRVAAPPPLTEIRRLAAGELAALPGPLRELGLEPAPCPVEISAGLRALADAVDAATR